MRTTFVVVDDFYDDPDDVRRRALQLTYRRPEGVNYPGSTAETTDALEPVLTTFSALLGGVEIRCRRNEGAFRVTTSKDAADRRSIVHVDSSDFSAVVHLSAEDHEGTYFYRHRALGLERVSAEHNLDPNVRAVIERDTLDLDAWEELHMIPMRYNRLVIFDGKFFHSGARELHGDAPAGGRLTQNFFFDRL